MKPYYETVVNDLNYIYFSNYKIKKLKRDRTVKCKQYQTNDFGLNWYHVVTR